MPVNNKNGTFRFETFWPKLPGYLDVVQHVWEPPVRTLDNIKVIHINLCHLAKNLKTWTRKHFCELRLKYEVATEIVRLLDEAQEHRQLSTPELALHRKGKGMILAFSALRKIKIHQRSCLLWLKVGDANTKLFHVKANARRKNFICSLKNEGTVAITHEDKAYLLRQFYCNLFAHYRERDIVLNWEELGIVSHDLNSLECVLSLYASLPNRRCRQ
jgi:hypothetical protein